VIICGLDDATDELVLVSKEDFSIKKVDFQEEGKTMMIHTEFSGDGKFAMI